MSLLMPLRGRALLVWVLIVAAMSGAAALVVTATRGAGIQ
jgi:hypothetical protein